MTTNTAHSPRLRRSCCLLLASLLTAAGCSGEEVASASESTMTTSDPSGTASGSTEATEASGSDGGSSTGMTGMTGTTATATTATADATTATTDASATTDESSSSEGTTADTGVEGPSFTDIYEQIILPNGCNAGYCHGGGAGGLLMTDEATSYANLVEVDAAAPMCAVTVRVVPGAPDESVLWYRARPMALDGGMEPCAPKMPEGSTGLSDADGQLLLDWIEGGAPE